MFLVVPVAVVAVVLAGVVVEQKLQRAIVGQACSWWSPGSRTRLARARPHSAASTSNFQCTGTGSGNASVAVRLLRQVVTAPGNGTTFRPLRRDCRCKRPLAEVA
jgi:hypothetical protein